MENPSQASFSGVSDSSVVSGEIEKLKLWSGQVEKPSGSPFNPGK